MGGWSRIGECSMTRYRVAEVSTTCRLGGDGGGGRGTIEGKPSLRGWKPSLSPTKYQGRSPRRSRHRPFHRNTIHIFHLVLLTSNSLMTQGCVRWRMTRISRCMRFASAGSVRRALSTTLIATRRRLKWWMPMRT